MLTKHLKLIAFAGLITLGFTFSNCRNNPAKQNDQDHVDHVEDADTLNTSAVYQDCSFDTSSYQPTTVKLLTYDEGWKIHWDQDDKVATVAINATDTLQLHIGGCDHYQYRASYITSPDKFVDTTFLLTKAKWVAENFFDNGLEAAFGNAIALGEYDLSQSTPGQWLHYDLKANDTWEENVVCEGIDFNLINNQTTITLSGYLN